MNEQDEEASVNDGMDIEKDVINSGFLENFPSIF